MNMDILHELDIKLHKKYASLRNSPFLFTEVYDGIFVLNWSPRNDKYVSEKRIDQMTEYIHKFLTKKKQKGYFYVGGSAIKVGDV